MTLEEKIFTPRNGYLIVAFAILIYFLLFAGEFKPHYRPIGSKDFTNLKPMLAATGLTSKGSFEAIFKNSIRAKIKISNKTTITYKATQKRCTLTKMIPEDGIISFDENFKIESSDCHKGKNGEEYEFIIEIPYEILDDSKVFTTNKTIIEKGRIIGQI